MATASDVTPDFVLGIKQEVDDLKESVDTQMLAMQAQFASMQSQISAFDMQTLQTQIETMFDTKIKTAIAMSGKATFESEDRYHKPILESRAIQ